MEALGSSSKASYQRKGPGLGIELASFAFLLILYHFVELDQRGCGTRSLLSVMLSIYKNQASFHVKLPKRDTLLHLTTSCEIATGQEISEEENIFGIAMGKK